MWGRSSVGSVTHLYILPGGEPTEVLAVEFTGLCKYYGLRGHVDADGEGLCGEETLDQTLLRVGSGRDEQRERHRGIGTGRFSAYIYLLETGGHQVVPGIGSR